MYNLTWASKQKKKGNVTIHVINICDHYAREKFYINTTNQSVSIWNFCSTTWFSEGKNQNACNSLLDAKNLYCYCKVRKKSNNKKFV